MSEPVLSRIDPAELADFHNALQQSKRIVAVLGAGISASSGLATFRGTNGLWRGQDVMQVATPAGFCHDPGLVWQFYSYRRHEALKAKPNAAHFALTELARRIPGFVTLTQNVDNLSPRAGHPEAQLRQLHGNLFNLRCVDEIGCGYVERGNFEDPLTPALDRVNKDETLTLGKIDPDNRPKANPILLAGLARKNAQILGDKFDDKGPTAVDLAPLKSAAAEGEQEPGARPPPMSDIRLSSGLSKEDLPQCPKCKNNILRPSVVWFGEALAETTAVEADALFAEDTEPIDLCLVIGTSSKVWPAAGYAEKARKKGARVATINMDAGDAKGLRPGHDWVFVGDAAAILPELLQPVIGNPEEWNSTCS
ncbi:NAD-dependent protein deacylase [Apiospora arundinis]|uniref:NAD-dependent protein deacylase n=1 Tax=Apiospora arundinis TaxID=335852 RepID=A0ABR2IHF7_9PEZI